MVIAGKEKGKSAKITKIMTGTNQVMLDGLNMVKRATRAKQGQSGQIITKVMPIHASNVMLVDPNNSKPTRISIKRDDKGGRVRIAVKSGKEIIV